MILKAVIPAAGLGTRLLSATKEQPKEMLPIFSNDVNGGLSLKPLVQLVFEQLFNFGIKDFCIIVGRGKRAIEDHFTPDYTYIERLNSRGKNHQASDLESFYHKVEESRIIWINQPEPKGFGDAVYTAQGFVNTEDFLVHAGDTYIISNRKSSLLSRLIQEHERTGAEATITLQHVKDPRRYGVAEVTPSQGCDLIVHSVTEKPEKPASNLAMMPLYIFKPTIFKALASTEPGKGGEIQLTDAIQKLIQWGHKVYAIKLRPDDLRLDIGTPETYWQAQKLSYEYFSGRKVMPLRQRAVYKSQRKTKL